MIRAILWDNDGVLVDTERLYLRATRDVLAAAGVELSEDLYARLFLKEGRGAWHLAAEKGATGEAIAAMRRERNALYDRLLAGGDLAVPGAGRVLRELHGRCVQGVVTSSRRDHLETIHRRTGLLRWLEFVVAREDYERSKPDPEPYLVGWRRTGLGKNECLVVEDSERGLAAAKAAGLACWVIPRGLSAAGDFSSADRVLSDVREVAEGLAGSGP